MGLARLLTPEQLAEWEAKQDARKVAGRIRRLAKSQGMYAKKSRAVKYANDWFIHDAHTGNLLTWEHGLNDDEALEFLSTKGDGDNE